MRYTRPGWLDHRMDASLPIFVMSIASKTEVASIGFVPAKNSRKLLMPSPSASRPGVVPPAPKYCCSQASGRPSPSESTSPEPN
jgi:hypothetical protein